MHICIAGSPRRESRSLNQLSCGSNEPRLIRRLLDVNRNLLGLGFFSLRKGQPKHPVLELSADIVGVDIGG